MFRILLVDDSSTVAKMLRAMLPSSEYDILSATDGEDAVQVAATEKPDIVLLSTILPRLNGFQVCRRLKSNAATAHIPVILLISQSFETNHARRAEQGVDGYLTRPFSPQELNEIIGRFMPQSV